MTKVNTDFGFAEIIKEDDHVRIDYVEVHPKYRGQGRASDIIEMAIEEAKKQAGKDLPVKIVAHEYDADVIELSDLVSFYERWFTIEDVGGDNVIMKL